MSTTVYDLITAVRDNLQEPTPNFWSDEEILGHLNRGAKDLWRKINGLWEHHFLVINDTDVYLPANTYELVGIPDDVYRIVLVEPRVLGDNSPNSSLVFKPKLYQSAEFQNARAMTPQAPTNQIIYYTQSQPGAPVGPPRIHVGPAVSSDVSLTITYNQVLPVFDETDTNPIPGESDQALIAWATAYAFSKQPSADGEPSTPNVNWLKVYATEKANLVQELGPRQIQEPEYVEGMFEGYEF